MKNIWVLFLGIILIGNVMLPVMAGEDVDGPKDFGLKEVWVLKALWARDSSVWGFATVRFSKSHCILLRVEFSFKSIQGDQIERFLDEADDRFELSF